MSDIEHTRLFSGVVKVVVTGYLSKTIKGCFVVKSDENLRVVKKRLLERMKADLIEKSPLFTKGVLSFTKFEEINVLGVYPYE